MTAKCPLCDREMIVGPSVDQHHLIPRSKKGVDKFDIHKICHRKIHSVFTENELNKYYHTWDRLKEHPEIEKFIKWVKKKHPEFNDNSITHNRKRK